MSYRIPTPMERLAEAISVNNVPDGLDVKGTTPDDPLPNPTTLLEADKEREQEADKQAEFPPPGGGTWERMAPESSASTPDDAPPPPTASEGVHPFAISPEEGLPTVPQDQLLKLLGKVLSAKYGAMVLYAHHADVLRAHYRDAIYDHFEEHLKEERQGAYDYAMKMVALGGNPPPKVDKVPEAQTLGQVFTSIIQAEKTLIKAERDLRAVCGEYIGLQLLVEENILKDQRHLDDARRMLVNLE